MRLFLTEVAEVPTPLSVKIMQLFLNNYVLAQIHIYIHPLIVLIIMWETCITCSGNVVREMCSLLLMGATSISGFIIINEKASKPELMILLNLVVIMTTNKVWKFLSYSGLQSPPVKNSIPCSVVIITIKFWFASFLVYALETRNWCGFH